MSGEEPIPRPASRVLLLDAEDRLLLLDARFDDGREGRLQLPVGGGLEAGESHEDAAHREIFEETGLTGVELGTWVWRRTHVWWLEGRAYDARERYFVARIPASAPLTAFRQPSKWERNYVSGRHWWTLDEIAAATSDTFVPTRLAQFLPPILRGEFPSEPFDVGI